MPNRRDRVSTIINILLRDTAASIHDLAVVLAVSEMTVRRDLQTLADEKVIKLLHGVAVLTPGSRPEENERQYTVSQHETLNVEQKMKIGQRAAALLNQDDIVIIDSGSTTDYLARAIPDSMNLTVICFALNIFLEVQQKKNCLLITTGGIFHENTLVMESPEGCELIRRHRANKAFISASGVNSRLGATCADHYEIGYKKTSIANALQRILLVDSSKFDKIRSAYFAELNDFDMIITDPGIPKEYRDIIEALGIQLVLA